MTKEEADLYRQYLVNRLPNARSASGGREVNCKCMYHDDHSRHMYINIPYKQGDSTVFYCQKCQAKGVVDPNRLSEWNIYNDEIAAILLRHSKTVFKKTGKVEGREVYSIINTYINQDELSAKKLDYINNRLGTNLSFEDCKQLKIVINLRDLLKANRIMKLTRHESLVNELDMNFVGFISLDNAFVNLRRIVPEGHVYKEIDKRYVNYSLFGKFENLERFYTIPTQINMMQRIKLHVAEGPFDILSIYLNVRNREEGIYTSISGNNYLGIVKHFIVNLKLYYIELHIYPDRPTPKDNSGDDYHMNQLADAVRPLNIPVYIHRNVFESEKDFGVPINRIKETIYKI